MRTQTVSMRLAMALLGNAVLLGLSVGGLALAADPDFSTVSDILGGRRSLLGIDDVVVVEVDRGAATTATIPTSNSHMSSPQLESTLAINHGAGDHRAGATGRGTNRLHHPPRAAAQGRGQTARRVGARQTRC